MNKNIIFFIKIKILEFYLFYFIVKCTFTLLFKQQMPLNVLRSGVRVISVHETVGVAFTEDCGTVVVEVVGVVEVKSILKLIQTIYI